jgi:protein-disulfide isomerase
MSSFWKSACAGAVGGAVIAVAVIFALASNGALPVAGPRIHDYLMAHPEIAAEMSDRYQDLQAAQQDDASTAAMRKIGIKAFFDPKIAFVTGPANAKKTLVEFYDYDCPYCRASLPAIEKYYAAHKNDTRFSLIEFPLPALHGPGAATAAKVSMAARLQPDKYIAFHFALMGAPDAIDTAAITAAAQKAGMDMKKLALDMNDPDIQTRIDEAHALAQRTHIDGTPTFIFNGKIHAGAVDDTTLNALMKS